MSIIATHLHIYLVTYNLLVSISLNYFYYHNYLMDDLNNNNNNYEEDQGEELEDDIYLVELHKRLTLMKQERKKAEQDTSLLNNRLKLLKGEENKVILYIIQTLKKIETTYKRTQDKMAYLTNQEERLRLKQNVKQERQSELELKGEKLQKDKIYNSMSLNQKKEEKIRQINAEALMLKEQKTINKELINYLKTQEQQNNRNKYEVVKIGHYMNEEKKRAMDHEKKSKIRMELEKKLLEELRLKEEAAKQYNRLEHEEIEVIKRIKTTTQVYKTSILFILCSVEQDLEKITLGPKLLSRPQINAKSSENVNQNHK